jgi:hypothetical protein
VSSNRTPKEGEAKHDQVPQTSGNAGGNANCGRIWGFCTRHRRTWSVKLRAGTCGAGAWDFRSSRPAVPQRRPPFASRPSRCVRFCTGSSIPPSLTDKPSPRPGRIEVIRIAIPNRFCHKHSTFLTLVNFRFLQCPHRFSAGGTEIEKLNALWLLQSTYAREVLERFPPGFSLLTPAVLFIRC